MGAGGATAALTAVGAAVQWATATAGAVVGVAVLVLGAGGTTSRFDLSGVAAAVGAGVAYAGCTVTGRMLLLRGVRGLTVMAVLFAVGAASMLPVLLVSDVRWLDTARGLAMVAWLGAIATGLSYLLFQRALSPAQRRRGRCRRAQPPGHGGTRASRCRCARRRRAPPAAGLD